MKITNHYNLPKAFEILANQQREYKPGRYSVTTILAGTKEILLKKYHDEELTMDVSDMIAMIFGTAAHHILELADPTSMKELRLEVEVIPGYFLTGQFDRYETRDFAIEDYKTAKAKKIEEGKFDDWRRQGLMYVWLCRKYDIYVERLRFHALIKDWSKFKVRSESDYPDRPIWTWEYEVTSRDLIEIDEFIKKKIKEIAYFEDKEFVPHCSETERWYTGSTYALRKKNSKRAFGIYETKREAEDRMKDGMYIEERYGMDMKCEHFCVANMHCDYYKNKLKVGGS